MLLGRVRSGAAARTSLSSWNQELARAGIELMADRRAAVAELSGPFVARATSLGLIDPIELSYRPRSKASAAEQLERELEEATDNDMTRGFSTHGPHRDDMRLTAAGRDLRRYGSQGQQRLGLLSLLLAERDALTALRQQAPLLLLDDVLSELDADRRGRLAEAIDDGGQSLITTADSAAIDSLGPAVTRLAVEDGQLVA